MILLAFHMRNFIATRDHRLMRRVNNWPAPKWVRIWMVYATRAGDGWLWCMVGVAVLLFGGPERFAAVVAACMAGSAGVVLFRLMKKTFNRRRPCHIAEHCWSDLLPPDQFSFPSGHAITAFAVAVSIGMFYPALLVGLVVCALSVAASRIILGMHFLSDVLAGAAIGIALGYSSYLLYG